MKQKFTIQSESVFYNNETINILYLDNKTTKYTLYQKERILQYFLKILVSKIKALFSKYLLNSANGESFNSTTIELL